MLEIDSLRPFDWGDLDALVALRKECADADDTGEAPSAEHVRMMLTLPGTDGLNRAFVLPDPRGGLTACYTAIELPGEEVDSVYVDVQVAPKHRSSGLEELLLGHAEAIGRRLHLGDRHALLHVNVPSRRERELGALLEGTGYRQARWFLEMVCELSAQGDLRPGAPPSGVKLRTASTEGDLRKLHAAINEAFRDHWRPIDFSFEQVEHFMKSPGSLASLVLLAEVETGEAVGGCFCSIREDYNLAHGAREGHVDVLAVRRPFRRQGVARAMLLEGLARLRSANMTSASLEVDLDSPTGATALYESAGFRERRRSVVYEKPLSV